MTDQDPAQSTSPTDTGWRNTVLPLTLLVVAFCAVLLITPVLPSVQWVIFSRAVLIIVGTLLPSILYRYFIQGRRPTLRREYQQNLRRLGYSEKDPQYDERFEAFYGADDTYDTFRLTIPFRRRPPAEPVQARSEVLSHPLRTLNSPIMMATVLTLLGWLLVFFPADPASTVFAPNRTPLAYGFLGAYVFSIGALVRQYVTDDLQARYYASITVRFLTVFVLAWLIDLIWPGTATAPTDTGLSLPGTLVDQRLLIAVIIGAFPALGLRLIQRSAAALLSLAFRGFHEPQPLNTLDGLNAYQEDRLLLEGVENLQNLVCADVVDLMLKTRFPVEQIIDWMDQALLQIHTRDRYDQFRQSGLRTATDFIDLYDLKTPAGAADPEHYKALARLINSQPAVEDLGWRKWLPKIGTNSAAALTEEQLKAKEGETVVLLEAIVVALRSDPNMYHVRYWRSHAFEVLPEDLEQIRTTADLKLMQGLPDEAIGLYNELVRDFPDKYVMRLYRGLAYYTQGEYDRAIADYDRAIEEYQRLVQAGGYKWDMLRFAYVERGRVYREQGENKKAKVAFEQALKEYPKFPEAKLELANLLLTDPMQYEAAIELLSEVIDESDFKRADVLANRGVARYELWKRDGRLPDKKAAELSQARDDLEAALRRKPDQISAYINLALVLGELGLVVDQEQALTTALRYALEAADDEVAYRVRLERGRLYLQQNELRAAQKDFGAAAQQLPCEPTAYVYLGATYRQMADLPGALDALKRAVGLFAQDIVAHEDQGGPVLARQQVAVVEQARASLELGRVYRLQKNTEAAQRELDQAMNLTHAARSVSADQQAQLDAVYTDAIFETGMLAYEQGQTELAAAQFATSASLYEVLDDTRHCAEANYYLGITTANADAAQVVLRKARKLLAGSAPDDELRQRITAALASLTRSTPSAPPNAPA